jgi:hypothetical protein
MAPYIITILLEKFGVIIGLESRIKMGLAGDFCHFNLIEAIKDYFSFSNLI